MTESRILTVLTNRLTYSIAHEVVFEAEAVDEDEAIKAVSLVRKIDRINCNAC